MEYSRDIGQIEIYNMKLKIVTYSKLNCEIPVASQQA